MRNLIIMLALAIPIGIFAQKLEIGIMAGASLYNGDLAPDKITDYFKVTHPALGVFFRFNAGDHFSARLGYNHAKVSGTDSLRSITSRRLSFESAIDEIYITAELNLFKWYPSRGELALSPYVFAGANLFRFDPQTMHQGQMVELQPLGTEGQGLPGYESKYKLTQLAVPFGVGIKIILGKKWTIGLEAGGRKLFTDYLDDVGSRKILFQELLAGNGELAATLSNPTFNPNGADPQLPYRRGSPANDWYYIGGMTISFAIFESGGNKKGLGCPTF